jgi:hypothetical protein
MGNTQCTKYYKYHREEINRFHSNCTVNHETYKSSNNYVNTSRWLNKSNSEATSYTTIDEIYHTPRCCSEVETIPYYYCDKNNPKDAVKQSYIVLAKREVTLVFDSYWNRRKKRKRTGYDKVQCILWILKEEHEKIVSQYNKPLIKFNEKYSDFNIGRIK